MSEIFQLVWAVLVDIFAIFFAAFVLIGLILESVQKFNIVIKLKNIFKYFYDQLIESGLKGIAVISLLISLIFNYYNFNGKSSICDGCEPLDEICLKYHDYLDGGDLEIGKDFIIQKDSELSNFGNRKNPKIAVKFIKSQTNKFTHFPRYYAVDKSSECNPYKKYLGQCDFYFYYVIDIVCLEPYVHLKILQDDLSFFRDYYNFPKR